MNFVFFITVGFHALFLLVPFVFTWVNSELFEVPKMLFVYGAAVLLGSLWVARMIRERRIIWKKHPLVTFLLLFVAGQIVATIFSIHFRTSLLGFYSRLNGGLLSSLAYATLFLTLFNNVSKQQRLRLLLTVAVGGLLAALYALPERFGASPSCFLMSGQWGVDCWKQAVQERVFGTFGQPNWLAMHLVGVTPLMGYFATRAEVRGRKVWLGALALTVLVVLFTKSRSGMVSLLAAGVVWAGWWFSPRLRAAWKAWKPGKRRKLPYTLAAVAAGAGALVLALILVSKTIPPAATEGFDLSRGSSSATIRLAVWRGALAVWQRSPLFGSGPGTFAYSYYLDRPAEHNLLSEWNNLYNKAHNEFLNYLAETGLVGTLTYLLFVIGALWFLSTAPASARSPITPERAVTASLIGLSVAHFFGFSTVSSNLLLFLLPAIVLLPQQPDEARLKKLRLWQALALWLAGIIAFTLLSRVVTFWQADWWYAESKRLQTQLEYSRAETALHTATDLMPEEALYYDEQASLYSQLALTYFLTEEATAATELSEAAIANSDYAITLNPRHLNFYKTRVRVFLLLAQMDKKYFSDAEKVLKAAQALSPTDAQLWFNLAVVQREQGKYNEAAATFQKTVELKPNYVVARAALGDLLVELGRAEEGKAQYRFILENLSSTDEVVRAKLNALELPQADQL